MHSYQRWAISATLTALLFVAVPLRAAQSISGGTVAGTVTDPSGAVVAGASVVLRNPIANYIKSATTDQNGAFRFNGVPLNPYHLSVTAGGFSPSEQDINVRTAVPIQLSLALTLAGGVTSVNVEAAGETLVENDPSAHTDVSRDMLDKLPTTSAANGLNEAILLTSPAAVADSNGFFHPLGDHAQTSYSVDGQPISDQQSKLFSTQVPVNAIGSIEMITGVPSAEYGDKTSLVVNATTRSALGATKPFGSLDTSWQSFGTWAENAAFGFGTPKIGNFIVFDSTRSGRFLDSPEFTALHDRGNNLTAFDRFDYQVSPQDSLHVNLYAIRNWFQVPNTYDQPNQDQRQRVMTYNIAPGYQHVFSGHTLLTVNLFLRHDQVNYYPSRDLFADQPATVSQLRFLTNYGLKSDLSYVAGHHNLKVGTQIMQTRLRENFSLGITDPGFNAPCVDASGNPVTATGFRDPSACSGPNVSANESFIPGLLPYDLSRGGSLLSFSGRHNVNEYAFYVNDTITLGNLSLNAGLRVDVYRGLVSDQAAGPRLGASYLIKRTKTVVRGGYSHTFETPYNENLILSSATGVGGLATGVSGASNDRALQPGTRDQFNAGMQQEIGKFLQVDADYFWKFTSNAYDFDSLLNTPIHFPISWRKSKIDGVGARVSTPLIHGFQLFTTLGHTRARFFGPEVGGLIFNAPLSNSVFRIDHDQAFQQTTNLRYQHGKDGVWTTFTWRYDSGEVASAVPDIATALTFTPAQQAAIGFHCGGTFATLTSGISSCSGSAGATRINIPAAGTENDDTNPARVTPRNILGVAIGTDNLRHAREGAPHISARFTIENLTNKVALYNFLSTFSGTHFLAPRTYQIGLGYVF